MAKAPTQEVALKKDDALPAHLQIKRQDKVKIGNTDTSDLIIPRVKLIQKISPEVDMFDNAKPGQFWHTVAEEPLGDVLRVVPILIRKTIALWAPRGDDRGILARSADCVHWDEGYANMTFRVKPKGSPNEIEVNTRGSIAESRLADWGSSVPGDPRSPPLAALTYNIMFYLADFPELSPAIVINTRSAVAPAKLLQSKIEIRPVQPYGQIYKMKTVPDGTPAEPFLNYAYESDGYVENEDLYHDLEAMYQRFSTDNTWKVNEETDESVGGASQPSGKTAPTGDKDSKF